MRPPSLVSLPLAAYLALAGCGSGSVDNASGGDGGPGTIDANRGDGDGGVVPTGSLFSHDEPWTQDVSTVAKSPASDAIIAALDSSGGWGTGDFRMDISIEILGADATTPRMAITPKDGPWAQANLGDSGLAEFYTPDCDDVMVPLPSNGALEGENAYTCENDGDCHLLVVANDERKLYEMWRANLVGGQLLAGCLAVWDLDKQYGDTLRGKGCTSADAGGFPITAMLATADEVAAGHVDHALRFILPNDQIRAGIYTPPGTHSTSATSGGANAPPYGARFRLKASFDENTLPSEGAKVLARALKKYGMFLSDGGNVPVTIANDRFTTAKWADLDVDSRSLSSIAPTDFEVVELGTLVDYDANTDCTRNP